MDLSIVTYTDNSSPAKLLCRVSHWNILLSMNQWTDPFIYKMHIFQKQIYLHLIVYIYWCRFVHDGEIKLFKWIWMKRKTNLILYECYLGVCFKLLKYICVYVCNFFLLSGIQYYINSFVYMTTNRTNTNLYIRSAYTCITKLMLLKLPPHL